MLEDFRKSLSVALAPKEVKQSVSEVFSGTSFVSGRGHTQLGAAPRAGTDNILKSYSHMPWLRATVNKVSDSVGESRWRLFANTGEEKNPDGSKRAIRNKRLQYASKGIRDSIYKQEQETENLKEITESPLLDLLENGNDRHKGYGVFKTTQMHIDLAGETFWVLEPNGIGGVESIWPVAPNWVKEFPTKEKPAYVMEVSGRRFEVAEEMVIAFIDPDPADPYGRGVGTARALSDELETDEYAAKHLKNFFLNGARPDLIVSVDGLRKEDTSAFETQWNNRHRGFWQSFKPAFLNRKVDVTEVGQSFQNMQMADLRKQERDIIMQVFGFPPEKFGILTQSNRATIQAADFFWTKDVVQPRLEFIRTILQHELVPMFDERLILDYDSPIVEDKEHKLNVMKGMPGAVKVNEWRKEAGLPDIGEEGEVFLFNPGTIAVDDVSDIPDPNEPTPTSPTDPNVAPSSADGSASRSFTELSPDELNEIETLAVKAIKDKLRRNTKSSALSN